MALYVVERDLSSVAPERLRLDQRDVASACIQLKAQGKRIRYISSAVVPADGRALDLFGADSAEVVKDAHTATQVPYSRIVEILDLTPSFVHRGTSRSRRCLQRVGASTDEGDANGSTHAMTAHASPELARWLADGQRLFAVCLETLEKSERLQARNQTLESENEMLREEVARLRQKVDVLQADRSEMVAAFRASRPGSSSPPRPPRRPGITGWAQVRDIVKVFSGDLGIMGPDGCIRLTGRKKLLINRGGFKVNPYEVEEVIKSHPKVEEVAVFGAPSASGDDVVCCAIVTMAACTTEEILLYCKERLADFKVPARIEFRDALPKSPAGKILRGQL